jgi:integrase
MAYIRKRMGKYQCVVRVSGYPTITKTFEHHKDAERFGKDLELKLFRGEYDLEKKKFPTFKDAFNRYKDEIISKKRSAEMESKLVRYILKEHWTNLRIDRVSSRVISAYRDKALKTLKASSVNRRLGVISNCFTICRKEWDYKIPNPVLSVRRPVNPEPRNRHLTEDEYNRIMKGNRTNPRMKFIIELALETALRRSEIARIKPEHVKGNLLKVPFSKTGSRTIPLTPRAQELLKENLPMSMSSNAIRLAWQRICKFYELEDCHFHDLRHMAIHHFANVKNISVADCMIISGHKEPRTLLRIYAQSRPKEVANKLNKM